jgi:hypothetical protein
VTAVTLRAGFDVVLNLLLVGSALLFAWATTRKLERHHDRLRLLELKTGWLHVKEGPGKRVEVVGSLGVQPIQATKDEDTPYAS